MTDRNAHWQTISISGKPADVFIPSQTAVFTRAILFLHGASERTIRDDPAFTSALQQEELPTVCPHGGRSWWLDRVSGEFDSAVSPMAFVRDQVVPWIANAWGIAPPAVGLLGISMGGQGALQLAYRHPRQFPVVAAISPAVDFHSIWGQGTPLDEIFADREAARQQTATLHIHPLNWPPHQMLVCDPDDEIWYDGVERLASKLSSMGIPFESDLHTSAGGHDWQYFRAMAGRCVAFLSERLPKGPALNR